ncbi:hypothetical protein EMGBD4_10890 [Verrucomicrobiota bacterium]|nr:hypothetical protein EMGBD4_10890 [Verrucomicrobiota bacterium]
MRLFALLSALGLSLIAPAQERVIVDGSIDGVVPRDGVPINVVADDRAFGDQVRAALGVHGALNLRPDASARVTISRSALTATAACDHPRFAFQTSVVGAR